MKFLFTAVSFLPCVVFFFVACGPNPGDGIPRQIPCSVKVVNHGKPIAGATVMLVSPSLEGQIVVSGMTDDSGVAAVKTKRRDYEGNGAPEGEYDVLILKPIDVSFGKSSKEIDAMTTDEMRVYDKEYQKQLKAVQREIPESLGDPGKSKLKATVTATGGEILEVDVKSFQ